MTYWAVIIAGDPRPLLITRARWYARYCAWWLAGEPPRVFVIPWQRNASLDRARRGGP